MALLKSRDEIMRQIDKAAHYLPLEQLALSPQCGFASSGRGNPLTEEQQWRKLELVTAVARKVWNGHKSRRLQYSAAGLRISDEPSASTSG